MARLVWVGVGAAGGIYTYRKGEHLFQALQAQEAMRVMRVVKSVGRRPRDPAMALHPASGGPSVAAPPSGLRIGRFRITRTDDLIPSQVREQAAETRPQEAGNGDVVDITEAARRQRRPGGSARRRAR